ncbi:MAG: hypothetical protein DMD65_00690 [Gemmatimonadetes bacterium]|nr:MAG: hypothetical protein DMD65_00690 [Gemmatimonadota bacterium]
MRGHGKLRRNDGPTERGAGLRHLARAPSFRPSFRPSVLPSPLGSGFAPALPRRSLYVHDGPRLDRDAVRRTARHRAGPRGVRDHAAQRPLVGRGDARRLLEPTRAPRPGRHHSRPGRAGGARPHRRRRTPARARPRGRRRDRWPQVPPGGGQRHLRRGYRRRDGAGGARRELRLAAGGEHAARARPAGTLRHPALPHARAPERGVHLGGDRASRGPHPGVECRPARSRRPPVKRAWCCVALVVACSDPAVPSRADIYGFSSGAPPDVFHWPADRLPVRFYAQPVGNLPFLVQRGIDIWASGFLYGEFTGVVVGDSTSADVVVAADSVPDVAPDPGPWVYACSGVTQYPPVDANNRLTGPPHVHLTVLVGHTEAEVAACLRRTAVHELGHSLGLLQHSADSTDLMYPPPEVAAPSERDRHTAEVLYHTPATILPPP